MAEKILIIDNDSVLKEALTNRFGQKKYELKITNNGSDGIELFKKEGFELIIMNMMISDMDGLQLIEKLNKLSGNKEIIIISEDSTFDQAVSAVADHGAYDILNKPFPKQEVLFLCVKRALLHQRLKNENKALVRSLRDANVQLEQRVKQRTALQAKLNEKLRTELKSRGKIESALRKAKERAEVANRAKSAFMAGMSHELRNPLNSVMGFCQVLQEKYFGPLTEKQEAYVKDIYESGKHLLNLINDILELVGIDSENRPLERRPVNLCQLIENSLNMIRHKALKHGIDIGLDIDEEFQETVIQLDPMRFKQILFNLLSNAVKFTPDGGNIGVQAEKMLVEQSQGEREILKVTVSDNGAGVADGDRNKIFEEFFQAKRGTTDKTPGAGLGLSIARRLIHQHGGKIWMESEGEGKGSRFIFVIPI